MENLILTIFLTIIGFNVLHTGLGNCAISKHMVEATNRIFTYRDEKGNYQLLRTEIVPTDYILYMVCTASNILETRCQDNGQFSIPLPMQCENPMPTIAMPVKDKDCSATMYAVGYIIESQQLELYRSCFDSTTVRVIYSESLVFHKTYFPNRPWVEFLTDGLISPTEAASYMKYRTYDNFCDIFGNAQRYLPNAGALIINRGHLVASADFLFVDQMSSTFRYLNIVPQIKSINDGNWQKIEKWVRRQVPENIPYLVKTGGIGTLLLLDEQGAYRAACLLGSDKIPVPEWTYKVIREANGSRLYVFLTYNSSFCTQRPLVLEICHTIECPFWLPDTAFDGYTFCCDPKNFPY